MESGLPGLKPIRDALKLTIPTVAEQATISPRFLYRVESGQQDCTTLKVRSIAAVLGCTTDDLLYPPSEGRLSEIRAAYHQREADRARQEAKAAS